MFSLQAQTLTLTKILRSHRRHDTAVFTGSSWWLRRPLCLKLPERPLNISAFVAFNAQRFPQALNLCGVKVNSRTNKHTGETSDSRICSRSSNHTNALVVHYHCCITFHHDGHFEPDGLLQHTGQSVSSPVKFLSLSRTGLHYRRPPNTCRLCDGAYVIVHRGRAVTCRVSLQSRVKSRLLLQYWLVESWKLLHKTPPAILSPQSQNTWISWKAFEDRWGRGGSGCRQVSVIPQQKWIWGKKLKITL